MKRYLIISIAMSACTTDAPQTAADSAKALADSNTAAARNAIVPPGEQPPPPPAATPPADDVVASEWQVTPAGIGSVKAGMTLDEANTILHGNFVIPTKLEECDFVRLKNKPDLLFMTENNVIARVDITKGDIATVEGAKIGDTEARIKSLYPGVATQPHKYTDGHYLVVTPKSGGTNRIIFETDGNKVLRYRSGKMPQVEYVEGCA